MFDHLLVHASQVSEPAPSADPDLLVRLIVAVVVILIVARYLKAVLFLLAVTVIVVLIVGIAQIEPYISQLIQDIESATGP